MQYLTGKLAFGITCDLDTPGLWNIPTSEYLDSSFKLSDSDNSPFKYWGIETGKIIPGREYTTFNVANHLRAYVDCLYKGEFDLLKDRYEEIIFYPKYCKEIFMIIYGKTRFLAEFEDINNFLTGEFGDRWLNFIESINAMSEKLSNGDTTKLDNLFKGVEEDKGYSASIRKHIKVD